MSNTPRYTLRDLYNRGTTGLDREPGDALCYWAHGEITALRAENAALRALLQVAKCPNCGGVGYTVTTDRFGCPEQEQCQWCFEQSAVLAKEAKS